MFCMSCNAEKQKIIIMRRKVREVLRSGPKSEVTRAGGGEVMWVGNSGTSTPRGRAQRAGSYLNAGFVISEEAVGPRLKSVIVTVFPYLRIIQQARSILRFHLIHLIKYRP